MKATIIIINILITGSDIYLGYGQSMLTFSSIPSVRPALKHALVPLESRTIPDECYGSPGTNLKHAMVHLELQDGFTEVPKHVFWPQNRLEHQAGVGGLGKDRRKII